MSQVQAQISQDISSSSASMSLTSFIDEAVLNHQKMEMKMGKKSRRPGFFQRFMTWCSRLGASLARTRSNTGSIIILTPAQQEQQKQAQAFLDSKMYESYATMLSYGYEPDIEQKKHFDAYIEKLMENNSDESKKLLETYLSLNYVLSEHLVYDYLLQAHYESHLEVVRKAMVQPEDDPKPHPDGYVRAHTHLMAEFKRVLGAKDFSHKFMKYLIAKMSGYSYGYQLEYQQESLLKLYWMNQELFFYNIALSDMMSFIKFNDTLAKKLSTSSISRFNEKWTDREMPKLIESYYKNDIARQLQKTKQTYHGALENFALKQAHESIEHPATRILPEAIKQKINAIEEIYWALKNSQAKVPDPQADFDMQNIFEKRIPEVLEKYLRVPEDYRNTMKHEQTGKTAYELMDESLDNYQQKLQAMLANRVQTQLADMNATKIYSNQIKQ